MHDAGADAAIAEYFPEVPAALAGLSPFQGVVLENKTQRMFAAPA